MQSALKDTKDLIGRRVEIKLFVDDWGMSYGRGPNPRPEPNLPTVQGTVLRRILGPAGWDYLIELDEPLLLDQEGMDRKARKLYSTSLISAMPLSEPDGKRCDFGLAALNEGKATHCFLFVVRDLEKIPNEIAKDDPAHEFLSPSICSGMVGLTTA